MCWFDLCRHCKKIPTTELITHPSPHRFTFFFWWEHWVPPPGKVQLYNPVISSTVTMFYLSSSDRIHLTLLPTSLHFPLPLSPWQPLLYTLFLFLWVRLFSPHFNLAQPVPLSLTPCVSHATFKKSFPTLRSWRYSPLWSSESFMVLPFTFKSSIHLVLIFVCDAK